MYKWGTLGNVCRQEGQDELCAGRYTLLLLLQEPLYLLASSSITAEDERLKWTGLSFPQYCARRLRSSLCLAGSWCSLSLSLTLSWLSIPPSFLFHLPIAQEENWDWMQGSCSSSARLLLKFGHFSGPVQRVPERWAQAGQGQSQCRQPRVNHGSSSGTSPSRPCLRPLWKCGWRVHSRGLWEVSDSEIVSEIVESHPHFL